MANLLKFLFAPVVGLGVVWFATKSAFHTGQIYAENCLLEIFGEDDE